MKTKPHAILFDLDGTLIDSKRTIAMHFVRALNELSIPHQLTEQIVADSLENSFEDINKEFGLGMNEEQFKTFVSRYRDNYYHQPLPGTEIFPGTESTLLSLRDMGFRIILATGKQIEIAEKSLEVLGLEKHFDLIQGWEPGLRAKPQPDILRRGMEKLSLPEGSGIMVGDTPVDIEAGRALGMPTFAALYGCGKKQTLERFQPDYFLNSITELPDILKNKFL